MTGLERPGVADRDAGTASWADAAGRALRVGSLAGGLQAAIADRSRGVAVVSVGLADLAAQVPVVPKTLFEIGSISKGFTCALLLRARQDGLVDLDRRVTDYLPWCRRSRN